MNETGEQVFRRQMAHQTKMALLSATASAIGLTVEELQVRVPLVSEWTDRIGRDEADYAAEIMRR